MTTLAADNKVTNFKVGNYCDVRIKEKWYNGIILKLPSDNGKMEVRKIAKIYNDCKFIL